MLSKGSERLAGDHAALDQLLKQLQAALSHGDVDGSYANLDLFWAKLAVHIRAEHLHLFPTVLKSAPNETRTAIERLRADHDFFMHQLGRAVETIRMLSNRPEQPGNDRELHTVKRAISEVEEKLADHNRIEEDHIYQLAGMVLNIEEQEELAKRINSELEKRPPRFAADIW